MSPGGQPVTQTTNNKQQTTAPLCLRPSLEADGADDDAADGAAGALDSEDEVSGLSGLMRRSRRRARDREESSDGRVCRRRISSLNH